MAKVEFLGPIGIDTMEIEVENMQELSLLLSEIPEMQEWIDNSAVAVNDTLVSSLDVVIKNSDTISILPPVCGG